MAVKWILEEEHSDRAVALIAENNTLIAPEFLVTEVAQTLVKRIRMGQLAHERLEPAIRYVRLVLRLHPSLPLVNDAVAIALEHDRSIYDALYVALARRTSVPLVSADERLVNALASHDQPVRWVGNV